MSAELRSAAASLDLEPARAALADLRREMETGTRECLEKGLRELEAARKIAVAGRAQAAAALLELGSRLNHGVHGGNTECHGELRGAPCLLRELRG